MDYSNKQLYSSKLLYQDGNIYEVYKRMTKNKKNSFSNQTTSQTSLETINRSKEKHNINKRKIQKNNHKNINSVDINRPHLSYTQFLKSKGIPFGTMEKRFRWQDLGHTNYPTGMNTFKTTSKHYKNYSNISKDEIKFKRQKKNTLFPWSDISLNTTKRVLLTNMGKDKDFNDYILKRHKKYYKNETDRIFGKAMNLRVMFLKTPLNYNYRGIKIVKKNKSCDLNLFREDYAKFELPKVRKHFAHLDDHVKDIIYFKNNKSMDDINYNRGNKGKKYNNNVNINQSYCF